MTARSEASQVDRTCEFCGKVFQLRKCEVRQGKGKYCSRQCWEQSLQVNPMPNGTIERVCEWCGKGFYIKPSTLKPGHARFCSPKCKGEYKTFENTETVCCQECGAEFTTWKSYLARGNGKFCSAKCQSAWYSENLRGPSHPLWRGGLTPYPAGWTQTFRRIIRERDGFKCMVCGSPEGIRSHHCHHINYMKLDLSLRNLILCCPSCHTKTTAGNRDEWELKLSLLLCNTYGYEYDFERVVA